MKIRDCVINREPIDNTFVLTVKFIGDQYDKFDNNQLDHVRSIYELNRECGIDSKSKMCSSYYDQRIDERLYSTLKVEKVIFNDPATIVFWNDGTKTVVKCGEGETFDEEKGFAIACTKKMFGNNHIYYGKMQKAIEKAVRQNSNTFLVNPEEVSNDNSKE